MQIAQLFFSTLTTPQGKLRMSQRGNIHEIMELFEELRPILTHAVVKYTDGTPHKLLK
jgi:hypothetical protein